jgi:RNA polymerase sigma-70 factor (ECF subfamily)
MEFDDFYRNYFDAIFGYIFKRVGNYDHSLDVVQEVFLAIHRKYNSVSALEPKQQLSYLYRTANSKIVDWVRSQKKTEKKLSFESESTAYITLFSDPEEVGILSEALHSLPVKYQEALSLRYIQDLDFSEIAEIVGKKESSVRSTVSRGLAMLRDSLKKMSEHR